MTDTILQEEALAFRKVECVIPLRDAVIQTDDLVASAAELAEVSRNVQANANAYLAVESYVSQFMGTVSAECWTREKATQYHRGMSGLLLTMGVNIPSGFAMASFEAVSVTQTKEENRNESGSKAVEFLKRILEAIKAGIKKFMELAKAFTQRVGRSGKSIVDASTTLKEKIAAVSGEPDTSKALENGKWSGYLQIGGVAGSPIKALDFLRVHGLLASEVWIESFDAASKAVGELAARKVAIPTSAVWSGLNDLKNLQKPWPGNVEMVIEGLPEGKPTIASMTSAKIKLTPGTTNATPLLALDRNACNSIVSAMASLGTKVVAAEGSLNTLIADMNKIDSSLNNVKPTEDGKVADEIKALPKLISAALDGPQVIYPYAAKIAQSAYRHVEESLKRYK